MKWGFILLFICMIISIIFNVDLLNLMLFIGIIGWVGFSLRESWKQLKFQQILGVVIYLAILVSLTVCFFYFIGNPIVNLISIGWLKTVVTFIIIICAIIPLSIIFQKGALKITNGKFPVMDTELGMADIEYPFNEEVQQLVRDEKVIKAVKLSRELYGYSLLKAKRYVNSLRE